MHQLEARLFASAMSSPPMLARRQVARISASIASDTGVGSDMSVRIL